MTEPMTIDKARVILHALDPGIAGGEYAKQMEAGQVNIHVANVKSAVQAMLAQLPPPVQSDEEIARRGVQGLQAGLAAALQSPSIIPIEQQVFLAEFKNALDAAYSVAGRDFADPERCAAALQPLKQTCNAFNEVVEYLTGKEVMNLASADVRKRVAANQKAAAAGKY